MVRRRQVLQEQLEREPQPREQAGIQVLEQQGALVAEGIGTASEQVLLGLGGVHLVLEHSTADALAAET